MKKNTPSTKKPKAPKAKAVKGETKRKAGLSPGNSSSRPRGQAQESVSPDPTNSASGIQKKVGRPRSYPAFLVTQNDYRFYFSTIPVSDLFQWCFVSSREEDPLMGFQRSLNENRADDIARYLAKSKGSIPTNIVLSAQSIAGITYNSRAKTISFRRERGAFLVLDGQHRLWGYQRCLQNFGMDYRVPVAVYERLARAQETKLFIDINTTQRGVPVALLLDIQNLAQIEDVINSQLRSIFDKLSEDPRSPLVGKLSKAKSVSGKISRVTFNRAVEHVLKSSVVGKLKNEDTYRLIRNYLAAFEAELRENKKFIFKSVYFESMFQVFEDVVRGTLAARGDAKQESLQATIKPITALDIEGAALNKTALTQAMRAALHQAVAVSGDKL